MKNVRPIFVSIWIPLRVISIINMRCPFCPVYYINMPRYPLRLPFFARVHIYQSILCMIGI